MEMLINNYRAYIAASVNAPVYANGVELNFQKAQEISEQIEQMLKEKKTAQR